jgi:tripeptidyl-peptidase II
MTGTMPLRTSHLALRTLALALLAGCGPSVTTAPTPVTPRIPDAPVASKPLARPDATYLLPPGLAYERRLMPLAPTGVPAWLQAHPTYDGRGVLIAILDSGIDPQVDGLKATTTGGSKLVDLRDFSGEGRIPLTRVTPQGSSVTIAGRTVTGFGRLLGVNPSGPWYGGVLREIPLGEVPASDVNWNNVVGDTLPVFVARANDGWVLLADLDGDGSLLNERPIHDYLVARESFGWAAPGKLPGMGFVANFREVAGEPVLDLVFDNSGHGTHVAGIAAGHDIFGAAGFDGVAPGAEILGLKIANDAQGGISTSGSMIAALDYAIRFAKERSRALVLNMSFGVGNEEEGKARIDQLFDSVLAAHPDLVFTVSAGNDGPGLSTLGFPGSAFNIISVGATFPRAFLMRDPGVGSDPIAFFTSRGGETARPDLVTPGVAFSTVPRWNLGGGEVKGGTSMASPHAAGLAALLVSALVQGNKPVVAARIRQALVTTAQPLDGLSVIDQGGGLPNVGRAWKWLEGNFAWVLVRATPLGPDGTPTGGSAAFRGNGLTRGDTLQRFLLTPIGDGARLPAEFTLRSDAPWLGIVTRPGTNPGNLREVVAHYDAAAVQPPGTYVGTVTLWGRDTMAGPLARMVHTIVTPVAPGTDITVPSAPLAAGLERRWSFGAQAGRPFVVKVASGASKDVIRAYLHEPGGQPFRAGHEQEGSTGEAAAVFPVDARDVVAGNYEVVAAAPPIAASSAGVTLTHAPFTMIADLRNNTAILALRNLTTAPVVVATAGTIIGGAREETMAGVGADTGQLALDLPAWVRRVEVDVEMPRGDWPRFTDFGLTLEDGEGRQIENAPLNYAFGRLSTELPRSRIGGPARLRLYPGWASLVPGQRWTVTVRIRYYGEENKGIALSSSDATTITIPAGSPEGISFVPGVASWALPAGFIPLVRWDATVGGGAPWTLEAPLAPAATPLMPAPR